jgi:hypothetical protein
VENFSGLWLVLQTQVSKEKKEEKEKAVKEVELF